MKMKKSVLIPVICFLGLYVSAIAHCSEMARETVRLVSAGQPAISSNDAPTVNIGDYIKQKTDDLLKQAGEGKLTEALVAAEALYKKYPSDYTVLIRYAQLLAWNKRYGESLDILKTARSKFAKSIELEEIEARVLLWAGDCKTAELRFDKLLRENADRLSTGLADTKRNYAYSLLCSRKTSQAEQVLREATAGAGASENDFLALGDILLKKGERRKTLHKYYLEAKVKCEKCPRLAGAAADAELKNSDVSDTIFNLRKDSENEKKFSYSQKVKIRRERNTFVTLKIDKLRFLNSSESSYRNMFYLGYSAPLYDKVRLNALYGEDSNRRERPSARESALTAEWFPRKNVRVVTGVEKKMLTPTIQAIRNTISGKSTMCRVEMAVGHKIAIALDAAATNYSDLNRSRKHNESIRYDLSKTLFISAGNTYLAYDADPLSGYWAPGKWTAQTVSLSHNIMLGKKFTFSKSYGLMSHRQGAGNRNTADFYSVSLKYRGKKNSIIYFDYEGSNANIAKSGSYSSKMLEMGFHFLY